MKIISCVLVAFMMSESAVAKMRWGFSTRLSCLFKNLVPPAYFEDQVRIWAPAPHQSPASVTSNFITIVKSTPPLNLCWCDRHTFGSKSLLVTPITQWMNESNSHFSIRIVSTIAKSITENFLRPRITRWPRSIQPQYDSSINLNWLNFRSAKNENSEWTERAQPLQPNPSTQSASVRAEKRRELTRNTPSRWFKFDYFALRKRPETRALIVLHSSTPRVSNSKRFELMARKIKRLLSSNFCPSSRFAFSVSQSLHPSSDCQTVNKFQKPFIVPRKAMFALRLLFFIFAQNKRWTLNVK